MRTFRRIVLLRFISFLRTCIFQRWCVKAISFEDARGCIVARVDLNQGFWPSRFYLYHEASEARQPRRGKHREGALWVSVGYVGNVLFVVHISLLIHRDAGDLTTVMLRAFGFINQSGSPAKILPYQVRTTTPLTHSTFFASWQEVENNRASSFSHLGNHTRSYQASSR